MRMRAAAERPAASGLCRLPAPFIDGRTKRYDEKPMKERSITMNNEKTNELIKGVLDSLTDEQKEKAKTCKSAKELMDFLGAEGVVLPDEALDAMAGGDDFWSQFKEFDKTITEPSTPYPPVKPPKWPCPKCGSWNVFNYDPGVFRLMRVRCLDCCFYGCRDGSPDTLNPQ